MRNKLHILCFLLLCFFGSALHAESYEVTYQVVEYNKSKDDFTLKTFGMQPANACAYFVNDYGATTGNRYNQIPRNREATLWVEGFEQCQLQGITLSMCSNNKEGAFGVEVSTTALSADGQTSNMLFSQKAKDFTEWYGMWVSKDLANYVNIDIPFDTPLSIDNNTGEMAITIKGGTREGSVYLQSITLHYETANKTESPMGWSYEKLEAKGKLNVGDVVMLYRSGDAAGDIDGMEVSHYLDAIGVATTSNVYEPDIEIFTLGQDETGKHWTLTDQWGRQLGATKAQGLAWDEGVTTWDITLGYSGATIASTNTKYGTLRYNAPAESYPRFWNYTSTSLALPYIYRRVKQNAPIACTSIVMPYEERSIALGQQDTLLIKAKVMPITTTDQRLTWKSSNPAIASIRDGIAIPHAVGETTITATTYDGSIFATTRLIVTPPISNDIKTIDGNSEHAQKHPNKFLRQGHIIIKKQDTQYDTNGRIYR